MNLRTMYIDNCKLKKTRNRLIGCSIKINEIDKRKSLFTTYILLRVFLSRICNCCTQYFYYSIYCVDT